MPSQTKLKSSFSMSLIFNLCTCKSTLKTTRVWCVTCVCAYVGLFVRMSMYATCILCVYGNVFGVYTYMSIDRLQIHASSVFRPVCILKRRILIIHNKHDVKYVIEIALETFHFSRKNLYVFHYFNRNVKTDSILFAFKMLLHSHSFFNFFH